MDCNENYQFGCLPIEILIEIFRYLTFDDIQSASLACRQWMMASEYEEFHKKLVLRFSKIILSDLLTPAKTFISSTRSFPNVIFEEVAIENCKKFLKNIGENGVRSITFHSQQLTSFEFCYILENLIELRELKITETSKILNDENFLIDSNHINKIRPIINNLKSIKISVLTPEIYSIQRLCCLIKGGLEEFEVNFEFSYHLNDTKIVGNVLRQIIYENAATLKKLSLKHIVDTDDFISSITVFNNFYLTSLRCIDVSPWRSLIIFISTQNTLKELDLSYSDQITDAHIKLLVKFIINLEKLILAKCINLSDRSLFAINETLKKLRILDISKCDRMTCYAVNETIVAKRNLKINELYLSGMEINTSCVVKLCRNLPNLKVLDLSHCMGINNGTVQRIIMELNELQYLNLQGCKLISDFALTGLNIETNKEEGFSIGRLKHLQYLNIKGCKLITDISFIKNIKLLELKTLCLPNIAVCASDIKLLSNNCPSIVNLDLSECQTMENVDKVMDAFNYFKRLRNFQFHKFQIDFMCAVK